MVLWFRNEANEVAEKYAEAVECLLAAKKIAAADPSVNSVFEMFKKVIREKSSSIDEKIKEKMKDF